MVTSTGLSWRFSALNRPPSGSQSKARFSIRFAHRATVGSGLRLREKKPVPLRARAITGAFLLPRRGHGTYSDCLAARRFPAFAASRSQKLQSGIAAVP